MFCKTVSVLAISVAFGLAACGKAPPRTADRQDAAGEAPGYLTPPTPLAVEPGATGPVVRGLAPPGARIRIAEPGGQPLFAPADDQGVWRVELPGSTETRIFGLAETAGRRQVQAQGYLLITAQGPAAQLRAGAGAVRLDPLKNPAIGAIDYDRDGAAMVSGRAPPQSLVFLRLDGRQIAEGRVDDQGRYAIALEAPIPPGAHTIEVAGDAFQNAAQLEVSSPEPLVSGPMRSQLTPGGLRIDWLTPGGGVQTTILVG